MTTIDHHRLHIARLLTAIGATLLLGVAQAVPILDGSMPSGAGAELSGALTDNCTLIINADQRDTDGDGYGNACDPDLNNDGIVNFFDLATLQSRFFTDDADADFNGDGTVNFIDLSVLSSMFFGAPGPNFVAPRDAGHGIPVVVPATWALLLAGLLAWRGVRRAHG